MRPTKFLKEINFFLEELENPEESKEMHEICRNELNNLFRKSKFVLYDYSDMIKSCKHDVLKIKNNIQKEYLDELDTDKSTMV